MICGKDLPRVRPVISRIRALNLASAFGALRRSLPSFAMLKPRNFRSSGRATALFRLVDLQLEPVGQEPAHGGHDPLAGAATANVDVAVIGIAAEAVTPPFQFLVEIIEHEVAQKGRKRAALRRPFLHRTDQTVLHDPSVKKRPDELEYALVGNPFRDTRQQKIVIDSVEKFLEVEVDHDVVAFGDIPLRLGHGLMGGTSRAEAVAMLGERRIPTLLKNLH